MKLISIFLTGLLLASNGILAAPRPNIILIMADDMGWGDPGYNSMTVTYPDGSPHPDQGWIKTPTMNTMAANGLRFDRFYSASAVCSPTRASCLTGRSPIRVGVPDANSGRLGFDETPLSEVLSAAGYTCGHFGKWHLGSMTTLRSDANRGGNAGVYSAPWHHGYDFCFATESKVPTHHPYRKPTNSLPLPTSFNDSNFYGTRYWRMPSTWNQTSGEGIAVPVNEVNNMVDGDDSKLLVDQVIPFIQNAASTDKPFFVVLWFHTPHKPLVDPDGVSGMDSSDALKDSIEDMDTAIGRLRTELDTLGIRGNTMLWLTSDNGPEDGVNSPNETSTTRSISSGRFLERKRSLHEGGLRVPGILEWPDVITSGMTTDFPAVTSDYYPTILDYLCLAIPGQKPLDGISLRPVINGTATARTNPIGFKYLSDKSWVNNQYKLIDDGSGWQLFDLVNIPAGQEVEQTPVATAANVGGKPQAIRNVYNTMLAEYTAWNEAATNDVPYIHASRPTVTLSSAQATVGKAFTVTATFNEDVAELNANEFTVTNGVASALTGSGANWSVTITPSSDGQVKISIPEAAAIDADGNPNAASNTLNINHSDPSTGAVISNGDLNTAVTKIGSNEGASAYRLDTLSGRILENATDTGLTAGQWVWSSLSRGFAFNPAGGIGGNGDGAFTQYLPGDPFNQRPRSVLQFGTDNSSTAGRRTFSMDVFMDDNSSANELSFLVELYAWDNGATEPQLGLGGAVGNSPVYNVTNLGGASTIFNKIIAAPSVADASWQTIKLGTYNLGSGYDHFAWRIGVMGATNGDGFAFDNVTVSAPTYQEWAGTFGLALGLQAFDSDPDQDNLKNGLEAWLGTDPSKSSSGLLMPVFVGSGMTLTHAISDSPPSDITGYYEWSGDLVNWYAGDGVEGSPTGSTVTIIPTTSGNEVTLTVTPSPLLERFFIRAGVMQD